MSQTKEYLYEVQQGREKPYTSAVEQTQEFLIVPDQICDECGFFFDPRKGGIVKGITAGVQDTLCKDCYALRFQLSDKAILK